MRRRILLYFIILILTVTGIMGIAVYTVSRSSYEQELTQSLYAEIGLFASQMDEDLSRLAEEYAAQLKTTRITVVDQSGAVLYDTEVAEPGNHANRPEIQEAFETGQGVSRRFSQSTWTTYLYVARRVEWQGQPVVVRFSVGMEQLRQIDQEILLFLCGGMLGAVGIALLMSGLFSKRVVMPVRALADFARAVSRGEEAPQFHYRRKDELGMLTRSVKIMQTRLARTIRRAEEKNTQLQTVLNSVPSGIVAMDPEGVILLLNSPAADMLGLVKDEAVGHVLQEVYRLDALHDFLGDPDQMSMELSDRGRTYTVTKAPMQGEDGAPMGTVVVLQDVTEMQRLLGMRSEFASNVSHELKTPLTSIKGFVDTLKNGAMDNPESAKRFLDIIDIETDRLTSLINDILEISDLESGRPDEAPAPCDVDTVAGEVLEMIAKSAQERGIVLSYHNDSGRREYPVDQYRMKQLLLNLVSNAVRYNRDHGKVDIYVDGTPERLTLRVRDTGIGIAPEDQPRVFERFYRVDKGRSRASGGTGLGLCIVKHIAQMYGGSVHVTSELGVGSEFVVNLPVKAQANGGATGDTK